ncbi:MAG: archaeal flagellar protein FlaJ [Thermoplasmata archaeon]|jgi:pilus assembly protein TadC|nr:archaeal flagellar protein FlaJ [Thermoplasmata archaeon]
MERFRRVLWTLVAAAAAAGVAAAASPGLPRRLGLLLLLAIGLGLAWLAASRKAVPDAKHVLGGAGYGAPRSRRVGLLHAAITVLYNAGIVVVVLATLARLGAVEAAFPPGVLAAFPLALAGFVVLLALAAKWRVEERGGAVHAWFTRLHAWVLGALAAPVALLGLALLARPAVRLPVVGELGEADLSVLVLVALLGVATHLFLTVQLPTVMDLYLGARRSLRRRREGAPTGTPPVVYAALLALGATAALGFLLWQLNVPAQLGNFRDQRVALLLILFPIGVAAFLGVSALQIMRESRRGLYKKKVPLQVRNAIVVYGLAAVAGLACAVLLGMVLTGSIDSVGPLPADLDTAKDLIMLAVLLTAAPIGLFLQRQNRRVDDIESRLPDFLNDLAESRRAGLTLAASLQSTALADYGGLTPEIRKMANQVSWGLAFNDALEQFAARVKTNLVARSTSLVIEASRTGGSVAEILKAAAKDAYEIRALTQERRVSMLNYLLVIYVVFFVFMGVIAVLDSQFIPHVLAANKAVGETAAAGSSPVGGGPTIDEGALRFTYYMAAVVQAIGNGIVAGILSEGRVTAGLRHVAIMTVVAWLVFRFLLAF